MLIRDQISQKVAQLAQTKAVPTTVSATDVTAIVVSLDITAIDSMSLELSELTMFVPQLQNAAFDQVKQWAQDLSQRITYLLENIGPLEFDPAAGQVLIRSSPPGQLANGAQFYEIMLSSTGNGTFSLRRYKSVQGKPGRDQVPMQMTIEVLLRLIDDLLDTIP